MGQHADFNKVTLGDGAGIAWDGRNSHENGYGCFFP
jgi:hypothetical protein